MSNELEAKFAIFKESDGFYVYKVGEDGKKIEKKNKEPYKTRGEAIPYLKALYAHSPDIKGEEQEIPDKGKNMQSQLILGSVQFEADTDNPRFLRFKDAILARAETNSNRDNVNDDGIKELASTIGGTKIDIEHDGKKNVGVYTAGRVGSEGELRVDGIVWLDACQELGVDPSDVINGKYGLSIEADAQTAECSVCHVVHNDSNSYCSHLRNKIRTGAERLLRGLRALGGALTLKPAGSGTGFATSLITFVASHQEQQDMDTENELTESEIEETVNSIAAAVSKREDVYPADKKRAEKEYGDVEYADEKNKKYPLDEKHIHAAWSYINMPKNAAKYSAEELAAIKGRIKRAAKKFGMEIAEDKKNEEKATMDKKDEMKEPPEEEKKETPKEEKKEDEGEKMKAAYVKMCKDMEEMTANLKTMEATKTEMEQKMKAAEEALGKANETIKAHRIEELKSKLVGSVMEEEEFKAETEALLALPEKAIELMTRNRKEQPTEDGKLKMAASEKPVEAPDKWVIA